MKNFQSHFLLSKKDIKEYVVDHLELFPKDAQLSVEEIGDGNINYVFRVVNLNDNYSVVIKQADKWLRSSKRPLDIQRNKIEASALQQQHKYAPTKVPTVYLYDEQMYTIIMEDISAFKNLRHELLQQITYPELADQLSSFIVDTLLPTTDLVMDPHEKKRMVQQFTNIEMCDISEDLVFTEPYNNYKERNIITNENQTFVEDYLYHNQALIYQITQLRESFMNHPQALLHGDLHTGSIFINTIGIKVIDPEFAFYGPIGYDLGNAFAHLFFPWAYHHHFSNNPTYLLYLKTTIAALFDLTKEKFNKKYTTTVTLDLYQNQSFKEKYISDCLSDALGFAGTEIIRRVVGDTKVAEITTAPYQDQRVVMERQLIKFGIELIQQRKVITTGDGLVQLFEYILA